MTERDEFIKKEFLRRIAALKVLSEDFEVDGIRFYGKTGSESLAFIGDVDKLASIMGAEAYDSKINDNSIRAFDYDGIEVWARVWGR